ncbi:rhizopine catabolism protein [Oleomonas cavernae]|uniref:Rhizopine catabolism protein n=1 Tax=Oleomonas cavernae TaxID=2320859 RepID=A0A418WFZ4_9PROT|nr:fatty acid desaturase [Oleomonas cavernae]RJF88928.1 rhizopine catabolism protein [Oleomonas cavernae]
MDEIFARKNLIKPGRLHALSARSDLAGFLQVGSHLAAIVASGAALWLTWGTWWAVPVFVLHGALLNFLYAGQHELSHWTPFKTRGLNAFFGRIFGFILLYPRSFDQIQHTAHHRHTQDWALDGELARDRYTLSSYLLWFFGPTYWYSRVARILRMSAGIVIEPYIPAERRADVILEARLHLAGYAAIAAASVALQSWAAVILWLAPLVATKCLHQLQNTIEHLGLTHEQNILKNTRTTRTNAFLRWLCWNMQYHTAHHAFPGVPFYKLPVLHKEIFEDNGLKPYAMTYWGFQRQVWRALSGGRTEADYPADRAWIAEPQDLPPAKVAVNA